MEVDTELLDEHLPRVLVWDVPEHDRGVGGACLLPALLALGHCRTTLDCQAAAACPAAARVSSAAGARIATGCCRCWSPALGALGMLSLGTSKSSRCLVLVTALAIAASATAASLLGLLPTLLELPPPFRSTRIGCHVWRRSRHRRIGWHCAGQRSDHALLSVTGAHTRAAWHGGRAFHAVDWERCPSVGHVLAVAGVVQLRK
mmetsp:Transcript_61727/g.180366  ORF Transcript_61727/g.180366 Transcript_61727/m.180366 type:complete len:203 (-) Transcript_61727:856-1464(-)